MTIEHVISAALTAALFFLGLLHKGAWDRINDLEGRINEHHEKDHVALAKEMGEMKGQLKECKKSHSLRDERDEE